jgi:Isochorismatase family
MLYDKNDAQLLLISCQQTLINASCDAQEISKQLVKLAKVAQIFQLPIWSVFNLSHLWGGQMEALKPFCPQPIESPSFSALGVLAPLLNPSVRAVGGNARSLPKHLQKPIEPAEPKRPVIAMAGCMVHVGIMQTALELMDSGYEPLVVVDACTSQNARDRDAAFDRLAGAGIELTTVEMLSMEWLQSSEAKESAAVLHQLFSQ